MTVRTVCENDQNVQQGHAFTKVKVEKMTKSVGIIGLGNAGKHICLNLHRNGLKVYCLDLNTQLYDGLPADIVPVSSAKEMAEKTSHVITALPKPAAVLACVNGPNGLFAGAREGKITKFGC